MEHLQEYADVFTSSDEYAKRFSGEMGKWLIRRQSNILEKFLTEIKPETVLDVGGGHGQVANEFNSRYKITVLGSTPDCSKQISGALSSDNCTFDSGNIEKLNYQDSSFDAVTCLRYLSHTDNWQSVIKELCRVAKKAVIVDFPPLLSFNILTPILYKLKKKLEGNTRHYSVFTKSEIFKEFTRNGYKLHASKGQFFFPMVLHRVIKNPEISNFVEYLPDLCKLTDLMGSPTIACFLKQI